MTTAGADPAHRDGPLRAERTSRAMKSLILLGTLALSNAAPAPIRYTLRFHAPQSHYIEVEAIVPTEGRDRVTLLMAVWTPGSYLVREYARNVEALEARPAGSAGAPPLRVEKVRKNRWAIATGGAAEVVVRYRVYAHEMSVQGNWVDSGFALLNGAATFLTIAEDGSPRAHEVSLELPADWKRSVTGLPKAPEGGPHRYIASDFDTLVDSPIYAGNPAVYEFAVDGKPHLLVNEGEAGVWDGPRSARDVEAIVKAQRDFWGGLPYDRYVFFNILSETGGGLEHANSTVLMTSRWATRKRDRYLGWLNLVSHEYFHTWNVKRLRPAELGPFDYENEVTTRSLWIAEGITSYYDRLFVRRAGLCTAEEFLAGDPPSPGSNDSRSKNDIERLHETPGRQVQPLEQASYDAWIKFYRRDENTANTAISYYVKGAVVAWLLDAKVRRATDGKHSLDDVMRLAFERYAGARGFTPEQFRAVASEVAGVDLSGFFHHALETTEELDYTEALAWFGLRFAAPKKNNNDEPKAWLGLETKIEGGRLVVSQVKRGTPGYDAGFNVGDEILAIGDLRVRADAWPKRLELYKPGETVSVLVARRDVLTRIEATLGAEPRASWALEIDPDASEASREHRRAWLGDGS
jgi:predicted metalloprotease with PDZ domain